jgi:hypothetical protein
MGWRAGTIDADIAIAFHHYDFYAQALAKIERGHELDRTDVQVLRA